MKTWRVLVLGCLPVSAIAVTGSTAPGVAHAAAMTLEMAVGESIEHR